MSNALNKDTVDWVIEHIKDTLSYKSEITQLQLKKNTVNDLVKWLENTHIPYSKAFTSKNFNSIEQIYSYAQVEMERILNICLNDEFSFHLDIPDKKFIYGIFLWLEENTVEKYCVIGEQVHFKTKEDALLYKLTWL